MKDLKQKIFGLYYGQRLGMHKNTKDDMFVISGNSIELLDYIEVTPLSMITDEHAIEVARIAWQRPNSNPVIESRDKHGLHIYIRDPHGINYHTRLTFEGEVKIHTQFDPLEEGEKYQSFTTNLGGVNLTDKLPIPYLAIADYYRSNGYATECFGVKVKELISQGIFKLK